MIPYQIVNLIATSNIDETLSLSFLYNSIKGCEYDPEQYHALILRSKKPKLTILINTSGKIIFTGAKSFKDIDTAYENFLSCLTKLGYNPKKNTIITQNIVVLCNLPKSINLENTLLNNLDKKIQYEPESFPGLNYKHDNPKFSALIFKSGKIIITGLKNEKMIQKSLDVIKEIIEPLSS
jgi:transcription initiation factor TFIID TATA-box-binding protein